MNVHPSVAKGGFDVDLVRADFPALSLTPYGKPLVYLDSGASAQKPRQVLDRMTKAYESEYANAHRGLHYLANAATDAFEAARESVRAFLNAGSTDEIIFTRNATDSINLVAASFGGMVIGEGDEIVLSIMEHHANIVPWHFHRERHGAKLVWVDCNDDGSFNIDNFEKSLTPRTKMVAITHMSNVLGTVVPVKEVIRIAHAYGIPVLVDGSQAVVHMKVDVRDLDADFYVFTGHKLYGPTGIGVLYGKKEHLDRMPPHHGGGDMINVVTKDTITYNTPPHRFEAGTPNIVEAIGLHAAIDYVHSIGYDAIEAHEHDLARYAMERLSANNALKIIGQAKDKGGIVSFEMRGAHAHDVATVIDRYGIAVRAGTHCAMPLLDRFGVTSTCRASLAIYNTRAEIDALAEGLIRAQSLFE
jgi:cysteine desulfurase/selenocysteine lyase